MAIRNWSYEEEKFMYWLCLPKKERKPQTQAALAEELGIDPGTLSRIKKDPEFRKEVNRRMIQATKTFWGRLPEYFDSVMNHAIGGNPIFATIVKDIIMKSDEFAHVFNPDEERKLRDPDKMTDEEIMDRIENIFTKASKKINRDGFKLPDPQSRANFPSA